VHNLSDPDEVSARIWVDDQLRFCIKQASSVVEAFAEECLASPPLKGLSQKRGGAVAMQPDRRCSIEWIEALRHQACDKAGEHSRTFMPSIIIVATLSSGLGRPSHILHRARRPHHREFREKKTLNLIPDEVRYQTRKLRKPA